MKWIFNVIFTLSSILSGTQPPPKSHSPSQTKGRHLRHRRTQPQTKSGNVRNETRHGRLRRTPRNLPRRRATPTPRQAHADTRHRGERHRTRGRPQRRHPHHEIGQDRGDQQHRRRGQVDTRRLRIARLQPRGGRGRHSGHGDVDGGRVGDDREEARGGAGEDEGDGGEGSRGGVEDGGFGVSDAVRAGAVAVGVRVGGGGYEE
mmetsp:Transcript_25918/g.40815  ORF Transcript_25918/g.40815 Transcript_25918/m.40815 type:complete len:204 (+) Transcript_25918:297-908(+)